MPVMERYETGMFSWADLATTDVEGAKRFYGELFGWKFEDLPAGDAGTYTMARLGGKDVGGMSGMMPGMREQGIPPHWTAYFTVDDVDARASKVGALGGKLVMPPMDVMDVGRMCIVEDPTGAKAALWQERGHKGAGVKNDPGTLAWVELMPQDTAKAQAFYTQLLGWTPDTRQMGPIQYTSFLVGGQPTAGMMKAQSDMPSNWLVYFAVESCDRTVEQASKLGAKVQVPAEDIPGVGRFSVLQDPQGAFFALIQFKS
jgi:predicted enzyme related to lactoylglutathione lyase